MNRYSIPTVHDRIRWFSEHSKLRKPMVRVVSSVQDFPPEQRVLGIAVTLSCLCDALGMNPHEVLAQVRNAARYVDGPYTVQYRAMTDYARGEILRGE